MINFHGFSVKRYSFILFLVFFSIVILNGCNGDSMDYNQNGLESGFIRSSEGTKALSYFAYQSDYTDFDLSNVTLNYSIGLSNGMKTYIDDEENFKLLVIVKDSNSNYDYNYVVLKEITDFTQDIYGYQETELNDQSYMIKFNHSDQIIIPSEMFVQTVGVIFLGFEAEYTRDGVESVTVFSTFLKINYWIEGEKVELSSDK